LLPRDYNANPSVANPDVNIPGRKYEKNVGAEYGEHIRQTSAICNSSASHTYGNVLGIVEKFILDQFPKDRFKTVTASTTISSRQLQRLPNKLIKKEMPIMVLVPRPSFGQDDNRFLGHTLINERVTNLHSMWGDGSLLELGHHREKNMYIHGHYNRAVMFVDIVMSFNTYSEQVNMMSYLYNVLPIGHPQSVRAPLELYIPGQFCSLISHYAGVPITDENGSVQQFLSLMNTMMYNPITYKLKGGSNTNEFFMYYLTDIDLTFQDVNQGQGVKDGQIRRNFDISFTVRCDFNTIGYFTLNSPDIKRPVNIQAPDSDVVVPIFSDVINLDDFQLPIGWQILGWPIFKLGENESSISLEPILNLSIKSVIDYHLKMGIPMDRFISIQFRENGQILNEEMFYIDWYKYELHITRPNTHRTYRLLISVSTEYINNLVKELNGLE